MNYAIKILKEELSKLVKPESIFVFEHPDFAEENNQKITSINEALKLLNEEKKKRVEISCDTCKYVLPIDRCSHPQGCEGDYELHEQDV